jgi:uncharacterized protein (DUF1786 family)
MKMRILVVDVGTGTQDILLFASDQPIENCCKLVMPSPTVVVANAIRRATADRRDLLLTGVTMGGGPCAWAAEDHLKAGLRLYATPDAARTFNDDLAEVERIGVRITDVQEAARLDGVLRIEMRDLDLDAIATALRAFGVNPQVDAQAVGVFDHGEAPPGTSDRAFRFAYLAERIRTVGNLRAFAYLRHDIPPSLTRFHAVASTVPRNLPLLVMDTGPAAMLGALDDERVRRADSCVIVNIGNFHTLAFHLVGGRIAGLFEHHTGLLTCEKLEGYLDQLARGVISNDEVFAAGGHGALIFSSAAQPPTLIAITGPQRRLLWDSMTNLHPTLHPDRVWVQARQKLPIYNAVPHGDMMLAGCFGLLRAFAAKMPEFAPAIEASLG